MAATKRPNWQTLGWYKPRRVWSKYYRNSRYYLDGDGSGEQTRNSHDAALAEWLDLRERIDATRAAANPDYLKAADKHDRFASLMSETATTEEERARAAELRTRAAELRRMAADPKAPDLHPTEADPLHWLGEAARLVWMDRARRVDGRRKRGESVAEQIADFMERKRTQAKAGQRSADRADALRCHLDYFAQWFGPGRRLTDIDSVAMEQYHTHLLGLASSDYSKRDRMAALKQFVRNRAAQAVMPLPLNMDSEDLLFRIETTEPTPMPVEHVRALIDAASDRTRLYLLLMANCGMTQSDIAELRRDELDLAAGTVTRQRSKTRKANGKVPTIAYPLWRSTLALLKAETAKTGDLALVNADGSPLIRRDIRADDKLKRTDNVKSAIARVYAKLKAREEPVAVDLPPKHIRKTGATLLAEHYDWATAYDYLGDVPSGVAAKHYVKPSTAKFGKAIAWLGRQFGQ